MSHVGSILATPRGISAVAAASIAEVGDEALAPLIAELEATPGAVELLVLGVGASPARLSEALIAAPARVGAAVRDDGDWPGGAHLQRVGRRRSARRRAADRRRMSADALAEAYAHCGQIARENERDLWLAALFAPERLRPHLHALAAFAHETGGVAARVREPLAGEMRLAWWREALAGARPAEAAGAPIAAALIDTMAKFALPVSAFEGLLQALTFDVYDDAMESLEALEAYGIATAGALIGAARARARRGARNGRARRRATRRGPGSRSRAPCSTSRSGVAGRCWRRAR